MSALTNNRLQLRSSGSQAAGLTLLAPPPASAGGNGRSTARSPSNVGGLNSGRLGPNGSQANLNGKPASQLNSQSSHHIMMNQVAAQGTFVVDHVYSYFKHDKVDLILTYECSDVIIIPKSVFQIMDEPQFVELSAYKHSGINQGSTVRA